MYTLFILKFGPVPYQYLVKYPDYLKNYKWKYFKDFLGKWPAAVECGVNFEGTVGGP